jgi:hypothetical protein
VPDLNEFFSSEKVYPPELEKIGGRKPCAKAGNVQMAIKILMWWDNV